MCCPPRPSRGLPLIQSIAILPGRVTSEPLVMRGQRGLSCDETPTRGSIGLQQSQATSDLPLVVAPV